TVGGAGGAGPPRPGLRACGGPDRAADPAPAPAAPAAPAPLPPALGSRVMDPGAATRPRAAAPHPRRPVGRPGRLGSHRAGAPRPLTARQPVMLRYLQVKPGLTVY